MTAPALQTYVQGQSVCSADNLNTFQQTCDTFGNMRALVGVVGMQIFTRGGFAIDDGSQGNFYWNAASVAAASNDVVVPNGAGSTGRWVRIPIVIDSPGGVFEYSTLTATIAADIPPAVTIVRTGGYSVPGDGGGAFYILASAGIGPGKFQSADGRWWVLSYQTLSPEMFGCKGDNATDDYANFLAMATFATATKYPNYLFGAGKTYFLNQHHTASNGIGSILWSQIPGLSINGNGSTVKAGGNFVRTSTAIGSINPFTIDRCSDWTLKNIELDGNNSTISFSGGVSESPFGYGFQCAGSIRGRVENVHTHNWITDGWIVAGDAATGLIASRDFEGVNILSEYNGRQGYTLSQLWKGTFINCHGNYTGKSSYGVHSPGKGLDIEQDRLFPVVDVDTKDLTFITCRYDYNKDGILSTAFPDNTKDITFLRCGGIMDPSDTNTNYFMTLNCGNIQILYGDWDLGQGPLACGVSPLTGQQVKLIGNIFRGQGPTILGTINNLPILVQSNTFICTGTTPMTSLSIINNISNQMEFVDNTVFIPKEVYVPRSGTNDGQFAIALPFAKRIENNTYTTDLVAASGPFSGTANYANGYDSAVNVNNETYIGTAPGTGDTIQPFINALFNTNFPYSLPNYPGPYANQGAATAAGLKSGNLFYTTTTGVVARVI